MGDIFVPKPGLWGGRVLVVIGRLSLSRVAKKRVEKSVPALHTTTPRHDDDDERHGCEENESTGTRESFDARRGAAGRGERSARGGFSNGWLFEIVCINWQVPLRERAFRALDGCAWAYV